MLRAIEKLELFLLNVPLVKPYRLAFGDVKQFETLIVRLTAENGASGFGEATYLTGYSDETVDGGWRLAEQLAESVVGRNARHYVSTLERVAPQAAFTATAFMTALEMASASPFLKAAGEMRVPLLGLLNSTDAGAMREEFESLLAQGYTTVKVKVGFDVESDVRHVHDAQKIVAGRARIRLDANQGYSEEQGRAFVAQLNPQDIELFEQPCAAGDWDAHCAVANVARVPMMLDESIYTVRDIDRAAELRAASFVKIKLMKFVSLRKVTEAIERIRSLGMEPVLGNGVACDPACWMEACVAAKSIRNAGEMNGFLKPVARLFADPLRCERGAIVLGPGYRPELDGAALKRFAVASRTFS